MSGSANVPFTPPTTPGQPQKSGPVVSVGGALPATAAAGFLCVTINGQDLRIPLFTPAQAGA